MRSVNGGLGGGRPRGGGDGAFAESLLAFVGVGAALIAILALVMMGLYWFGLPYGAPLTLLGVYLFAYRFFFNERGQRSTWNAEFLAVISCGSSLVLLTPLVRWPGPLFGIPLLLFLGQFVSTPLICHPMCGGLVVSVPVGTCLGALGWHLGICRLAAFTASWRLASADVHGLVLALFAVLMMQIFVCWGRVAGPANFHRVLVPLLTGIYFATGCSSFLPPAYGLNLEALMAQGTCAVDAVGLSGPLCFLVQLIFAAAIGMFAYAKAVAAKAKTQEKNGNGAHDLVKGLLPENNGEQRAMERSSMPGMDNAEDRFAMIVNAVNDETYDLSTLDDTARGIVEVCRKDEDERYRLLFGGGLL